MTSTAACERGLTAAAARLAGLAFFLGDFAGGAGFGGFAGRGRAAFLLDFAGTFRGLGAGIGLAIIKGWRRGATRRPASWIDERHRPSPAGKGRWRSHQKEQPNLSGA